MQEEMLFQVIIYFAGVNEVECVTLKMDMEQNNNIFIF
jgi:hypothetical protein